MRISDYLQVFVTTPRIDAVKRRRKYQGSKIPTIENTQDQTDVFVISSHTQQACKLASLQAEIR